MLSFIFLTLFLLLHPVRLAVSRTNPQVLDTGVMPEDWITEPDQDGTNGNTLKVFSLYKDDISCFWFALHSREEHQQQTKSNVAIFH